jgi:hypothetical protein
MNLIQRYKRWRLRRDLKKVKKIVKKIDRQLSGFPRQQRRQFYRDLAKDQSPLDTLLEHTIIGRGK